MADPTSVRDASDPGDATGRNFRYQHAYGVMLLVAAKRGERPYVAIWCEQHEDFLAQRDDGLFDGYQVKTSRPELGAWRMNDPELVKSIGRFCDLIAAYGPRIGTLHFVSNTEFDEVTPDSRDARRRGRSPRLFLEHVRACTAPTELSPPFSDAFDDLQASCGCTANELLAVLQRVDLVLGPSRSDFDASLAHEHLGGLHECRGLNAAQLDGFRDELVAIVHRASSLQVTDAIRHLRPLIDASDPDPALAAKRVAVKVVAYCAAPPEPTFLFPGEPELVLGDARPEHILDRKLAAGGLTEEAGYLRARERAAEYSLLEDVERRPEDYPGLLRQIEQIVLGETAEAHLRARQQPAPYGPAMLIDVQDRLRRVADDRPATVGHHRYDCLIGMVGLLTSDCRVWWSARFPIDPEAA